MQDPNNNLFLRLNGLLNIAQISDKVILNDRLKVFMDDFYIAVGCKEMIPPYVEEKDLSEIKDNLYKKIAMNIGEFLLMNGFIKFTEKPFDHTNGDEVDGSMLKGTQVIATMRFLSEEKIVPRGTKEKYN